MTVRLRAAIWGGPPGFQLWPCLATPCLRFPVCRAVPSRPWEAVCEEAHRVAPGALLSLRQQAPAGCWAHWDRLQAPGAAQQPGSALDDRRAGLRGDSGRCLGMARGRKARSALRACPRNGGQRAPDSPSPPGSSGPAEAGTSGSRSSCGKASAAGVATRHGNAARRAWNFPQTCMFPIKALGPEDF